MKTIFWSFSKRKVDELKIEIPNYIGQEII